MLYCPKCRSVCEDTTAKCPHCKNTKLRAVDGEDLVLLHRADQYTAQRLGEQFDGAGIVYKLEPFGTGRVSYLYDSEVMPTDKNIYVRYGDLPTAQDFSRRMKERLDREQQAEAGAEEFEDMPRKKRIVVQILSVIAFLVLVMLTVFGADALANWLKGLFGI